MYQESGNKSLLQSARQNFVKKVYATLSIQLLVTVLVVYMSVKSRKFLKFLIKNYGLFWMSFIGSIITMIALYFGNISRKSPINYFVMGLFTLFQSLMVSYVCMFYQPSSVLMCAIATLSVTLGLTYYAMTTKQDFTSNTFITKGIFYTVSWAALSISLINLMFLRSSIIQLGLSVLFCLIYCIYVLIDTQSILGNGKKSVALDDYILGATTLYVDIIQLFIRILRILGKKKDE